ncbi:hypothetical protein M5K25_011284 [Dendrobium thyrsiflorum]|uniref:Uncharacterized protein n=1 Tax=Dendrobium thyrsiflorum TaxID=117978 RepID=A0ABD0V2N7_DENTH
MVPSSRAIVSLVYLVKGGSRPNLTEGSLPAVMGCVVQGYLVDLGVNHTGSGHNHNLVVSFGAEPPGSESLGHNRLPAMSFGSKTAGTAPGSHPTTLRKTCIGDFSVHRKRRKRALEVLNIIPFWDDD